MPDQNTSVAFPFPAHSACKILQAGEHNLPRPGFKAYLVGSFPSQRYSLSAGGVPLMYVHLKLYLCDICIWVLYKTNSFEGPLAGGLPEGWLWLGQNMSASLGKASTCICCRKVFLVLLPPCCKSSDQQVD